MEYNQIRPHSAKNYYPTAPERILTGTNLTSRKTGGACQFVKAKRWIDAMLVIRANQSEIRYALKMISD
jgi:hypothetical protein